MSKSPDLKMLRGANKGSFQDLNTFLAAATMASAIGKKSVVDENVKKVMWYDEQIYVLISDTDD